MVMQVTQDQQVMELYKILTEAGLLRKIYIVTDSSGGFTQRQDKQ